MAKPSTIGVLDTLVALQSVTTVQESTYGSRQDSVTSLGNVWARVVETSEAEDTEAGAQRRATRRATVRIRWRADVDARCRVLINGLLYSIDGCVAAGRQQWLDITCSHADNLT